MYRGHTPGEWIGMSNIFIVDDNIELLYLYERAISMKSCHNIIGMARNGLEAVRIYKELIVKPDLVIMDVNMPVMDGVSSALAIREYDGSARIMFATADDTITRSLPQELSGTIILRKPFTMSEFLCSIRAALNGHMIPGEVMV